MTAATLKPQQARKIHSAERACDEAKAEYERRRLERNAIRDRYRDRVPLTDEIVVGGIRLKRVTKTSGERFRLKAYLAAHKLTAAMRPFVSPASQYEDWFVDEVQSQSD